MPLLVLLAAQAAPAPQIAVPPAPVSQLPVSRTATTEATSIATSTPPDVELRAWVRADRVEVRREGMARVMLAASPERDRASEIARNAAPGESNYRNLTIRTYHAITLADPLARLIGSDGEGSDPQPENDNQTGD